VETIAAPTMIAAPTLQTVAMPAVGTTYGAPPITTMGAPFAAPTIIGGYGAPLTTMSLGDRAYGAF